MNKYRIKKNGEVVDAFESPTAQEALSRVVLNVGAHHIKLERWDGKSWELVFEGKVKTVGRSI